MHATCSHCGASIGPGAWSELELVERLPAGRLRALVTVWPDGAVVEIRRCDCGRPLARKVGSTSAVQ